MRGFFKKLEEMFSADPQPNTEERDQPPRQEGGAPADNDENQGDPDGEYGERATGYAALLEPDATVEEFHEILRRGPVGVWFGEVDESSDAYEVVMFSPGYTGQTTVHAADGTLREQCLFEWQELTDHTIRMRRVAWVAAEDDQEADSDDVEAEEATLEEWDEEEGLDGEPGEPEQGEWETIPYEFLPEDAEEPEILMCRAGEDSFPTSCRRGDGPLAFSPDNTRAFLETRFRPQDDEDDKPEER